MRRASLAGAIPIQSLLRRRQRSRVYGGFVLFRNARAAGKYRQLPPAPGVGILLHRIRLFYFKYLPRVSGKLLTWHS